MNSLRNDTEMAGICAEDGLHDEPNYELNCAPNYERRDDRSRDIVDHAIALRQSCNIMSAVEYLKSHDIAADVIERVMLAPERRRRAR